MNTDIYFHCMKDKKKKIHLTIWQCIGPDFALFGQVKQTISILQNNERHNISDNCLNFHSVQKFT